MQAGRKPHPEIRPTCRATARARSPHGGRGGWEGFEGWQSQPKHRSEDCTHMGDSERKKGVHRHRLGRVEERGRLGEIGRVVYETIRPRDELEIDVRVVRDDVEVCEGLVGPVQSPRRSPRSAPTMKVAVPGD